MPNAAPMINSAMLDSFSPKTNDILTVNVSASDADSDPITFDYVWKVNGNTVKSTLGTSSTNDTLDLIQSGNGNKNDYVSLVITPYDPYTSGMTANPGATVANTAPTFSISNQENLRGDVVALQVNVSDADGDTLSYSAMALPPGLSINSSTGLISGTVSSSAVTNQAYLASVSVNDGGGNVNQNFNWTIVNHAPTLTGHTFYVEKNQPLGNINFLDFAADMDSNDTLTFTPGTGPWQGQLTYNNGIWTYTPASNWTGTDTINGTVSDGAANSTSAYFPFHVVTQTPDQLYATYLAAVAVADADYLDAVADRDAAIASARASAQADADDLYADYEDAVAVAQATYDAAIADAEDDYRTAVVAADADRAAAIASDYATYEAALSDAQDSFEAATATEYQDYEDALAAADADYDNAIASYVEARDDAYDAWQLDLEDEDLEDAYNDAQDALDVAIATAAALRDDDYAAALAVYEAAVEGPNATFYAAGQSAWVDFASATATFDDDWDDAQSVAWAIYLAAMDDAYDTLADADDAGWSTYTDGIDSLEAALASTEAGIESTYGTQVAAALSAWEITEGDAWDNYETGIGALPGDPGLQARVDAPVAGAFIGLATERVGAVFANQPLDVAQIRWSAAGIDRALERAISGWNNNQALTLASINQIIQNNPNLPGEIAAALQLVRHFVYQYGEDSNNIGPLAASFNVRLATDPIGIAQVQIFRTRLGADPLAFVGAAERSLRLDARELNRAFLTMRDAFMRPALATRLYPPSTGNFQNLNAQGRADLALEMATSIRQGQLYGDCAFISAMINKVRLSGFAWLNSQIQPNYLQDANGRRVLAGYRVRFWNFGEFPAAEVWANVLIPNPAMRAMHGGTNNNSLWFTIYEIAYLQYRLNTGQVPPLATNFTGNYLQAAVAGEIALSAIHNIQGLIGDHWNLDSQLQGGSLAMELNKPTAIMTAGTRSSFNLQMRNRLGELGLTLYPGHGYAVVGYNDMTGAVTLRNPHNNGSYLGGAQFTISLNDFRIFYNQLASDRYAERPAP